MRAGMLVVSFLASENDGDKPRSIGAGDDWWGMRFSVYFVQPGWHYFMQLVEYRKADILILLHL